MTDKKNAIAAKFRAPNINTPVAIAKTKASNSAPVRLAFRQLLQRALRQYHLLLFEDLSWAEWIRQYHLLRQNEIVTASKLKTKRVYIFSDN